MISTKTHYETYNDELLIIFEAIKTWKYYLKDCKYKVLVLTNHKTFVNLWIIRVWAFVRSSKLKNFLDLIFESIITRKRLTELQMHCLISFRRIKPKKMSYKLKTLRFFISYSSYWPMPVSQASAPQPSYCYYIKPLSMGSTFYTSFKNSKTISKVN